MATTPAVHSAKPGGPRAAPTPAAARLIEYAPAPETAKIVIAPRYGHFIGGRFVEPAAAAQVDRPLYFQTVNPATEETLSEVAQGSEADVDAAVRAARRAQPGWAALKAADRAKYLFRIARRVQERARELAILETMDGGKPIRESRDVDVPLAAAHFFYYAGWADKLAYAFPRGGEPREVQGGTTRRGTRQPKNRRGASVHPGMRHGASVHPRPVGVCGQIIPWNFPLLMAAWKLAPALACGNTCVLKPAETTPLTALRLAEILMEVGLPPGVVNIVTGDGRTGAALVEHPGVDKIAFTGSTEVGKRIAAAVAGASPSPREEVGGRVGSSSGDGSRRPKRGDRGLEARSTIEAKRLTLELGGKSANIIFADASIDQAVEGIISAIYFNQGHVCCAGSRLFVEESAAEEVVAKLRLRLASLRVGDPLDKNTDVGAINSRAQLERVEHYIRTGREEGAELHVANGHSNNHEDRRGASVHPRASRGDGLPARGYWCRPCFFTGVQPAHTIAREEIFGPVLAVMTFRTPEEAITRANNSPYGLAAGVWTDKGSKVFEVARQLKAGVVWLNTYNRFDPASPFGGFKESGFGREGGLQGLRAYVDL